MRRCAVWFGMAMSLLLMAAVSAQAAESDMYSQTVTVQSQSAAERTRAASEGLAKVLVRVSGVVDLTSPGHKAEPILRDASRYIDQFQYQSAVDENGNRVEQLVMSFTPIVIERILRQVGLPLWPINRSRILVWLVSDDPEVGRQLINDPSSEVAQGLTQAATERGVQLRWPLLDLDDQLAIKGDDVWTFQEETILAASQRYQVDTVLVGRYMKTSQGQWWTSWQFFHGGENRFYDLRVASGLLAGQQAIGPLADYLAQRYGVVLGSSDQPQLMLEVTSVMSFADYRGVLNYLRQLALVRASQLLTVKGDTLLFAVQLGGSQEQLLNTLSLDRKLRPYASDSPAGWDDTSAMGPLRVQWQGK